MRSGNSNDSRAHPRQSINGMGNVMMSQASLIDPTNHHNIATIATICNNYEVQHCLSSMTSETDRVNFSKFQNPSSTRDSSAGFGVMSPLNQESTKGNHASQSQYQILDCEERIRVH